MVTFNELCFSDDVQTLSLECSVEEGEQIEKIYLEYYKNRTTSGAPSSKKLLIWENPNPEPDPHGGSSDSGYDADIEEPDYVDVTNVKVKVDASQLSISNNGVDKFEGGAFYILVHWKDIDDDDHYDMGLLLDWTHVYKIGMDSIAKFVYGCSKMYCEMPEQFEQIVIVIHALQLAIETKDIDMIDTLWSRFISFSPLNSVSSCNCR